MSPYTFEPDPTNGPDDAGEPTRRVLSLQEIADDILLSTVEGVGPITTERLLERFGTPAAVLGAPASELTQVEKVGPELARKIAEAPRNNDVRAIIRFCEENRITVISINDSRYPERLRNIATPPRLLYVRGEILPQDEKCISVIGTRSATEYGRIQTTRLVRELVGAGFTVVSGLALGIDGCAHRAALDANGRTLAVLGGGVAKIYPREHEDLAARVMRSGAIISEYHPLTTPNSGHFPARNRIVSGLSIGTLVVESGKRGGSMITARLAAEQNRDVYAVPGPIDSPASQGCHELLRDGAILVESVDDILFSLPSYTPPPYSMKGRRLADEPIAAGSAGISERSMESIARPKAPGKSKSASKSRRTESKSRPADVAEPAPNESTSGENPTPPPTTPTKSKPRTKPQPVEDAPAPEPKPTRPLPPLNDVEKAIVDQVGETPILIDDLIRATKLPASQVIGAVTGLEFKQVLRRCEGNAVRRCE